MALFLMVSPCCKNGNNSVLEDSNQILRKHNETNKPSNNNSSDKTCITPEPILC